MRESLFVGTRKPRPLYFEMVGECQWRFSDLIRTMFAVYLKNENHTDSDFNQIIIDNNYEYFKFVEKLRELNVCEEVVSYFNKIRIRRNILAHSVVRVTSGDLLAHLTHQVKLYANPKNDNQRRANEQYKLLGYLIDKADPPNSYIHITYSFLQDMILEIKTLSKHLDNVLDMRQRGVDEKMIKPQPITPESLIPMLKYLLSPELNKDSSVNDFEKSMQTEAFFDNQIKPLFINDNMFLGLISRSGSIYRSIESKRKTIEQALKNYHEIPKMP